MRNKWNIRNNPLAQRTDIVAEDGTLIAFDVARWGMPNADANAHIIAAAPELCDALEDALALIENGLEMVDKEPLEVAAAAREAIDKARGKKAVGA